MSDDLLFEDLPEHRVSKIAAHTGNRAVPPSQRDDADFYETPAVLTRSFLRVARPPGPIWEPCAGRGAMSRVMRAEGYDVVVTDLNAHDHRDEDVETGVDFLATDRQWSGSVVTNPPFKFATAFVRRAIEVAPYVAMILPLNFLCRKETTELDFCAEIWAYAPRAPRMHRDGHTGKLAAPTMNVAVFVWREDHVGPTHTSRLYWREHI